jgi:hypothetical protein
MAKAKNPRGMPSSEVLETATRSIARPIVMMHPLKIIGGGILIATLLAREKNALNRQKAPYLF